MALINKEWTGMSRIHVVKRNDDDSAPRVVGWFDSEDAQVFTEATSPQTVTSWGFGSRTEVSRAAQKLLRTAEGRWVMALEFGPPLGMEYRFVAEGEASAWLSENGYGQAALDLVDDAPERGPGRPEIGGRVEVRLGGLLAAVDEFARRKRINRAEAVRRLVGQALQRMDG
jgi:hypothetical protein